MPRLTAQKSMHREGNLKRTKRKTKRKKQEKGRGGKPILSKDPVWRRRERNKNLVNDGLLV